MSATDTDMLAASRAGDREAYRRIVERYQAMVCAVAYSHTGDAALSEDIAQETFLAAWQRLERLRQPERLGPWLAAIARNRARDAWRKRRRDPLHGAESMDEARLAPVQEASESDKAALVWETLEHLPVAYREALVLYYREGKDVADTARLLGLTEDCVKQRLSRGRTMLRTRVADAVEETLTGYQGPSGFALAVVGALPALASTQAAAQVAAGGAAAATTGKGLAGIGSAAALGGLAGAVAGMTGGFFGMWASIKNSPTLRIRRYMLRVSIWTYAFIWVFLAYEAGCGVLFWPQPRVMTMTAAAGWILYLPALFFLIVMCNKGAMTIARQDGGELEPPEVPLESSALSLRLLRRDRYIVMPIVLLASAVIAYWAASLPGVGPTMGTLLAIMAVASHYVFWRMCGRGMAMSADEAAFEETAPAFGVEAWIRPGSVAVRQPSARTRYWNDFFSLAGANWGPAAWMIVSPVVAGQYDVASLVVANCVLVTLVSAYTFRRYPEYRRRWYAACMLYLGVFDGVVVARYASGWMDQGIDFTPLYGWAGGAIVFGLYFVLGMALLLHERWTQAPTTVKTD